MLSNVRLDSSVLIEKNRSHMRNIGRYSIDKVELNLKNVSSVDKIVKPPQ